MAGAVHETTQRVVEVLQTLTKAMSMVENVTDPSAFSEQMCVRQSSNRAGIVRLTGLSCMPTSLAEQTLLFSLAKD